MRAPRMILAVLVVAVMANVALADTPGTVSGQAGWLETVRAVETPPPVADRPADWWLEPVDLGCGFGFSSSKSLRFISEDNNLKVRFGGRYQWDYGWINGGNDLIDKTGKELESQADSRRTYLYLTAELFETVDVKIEVNFTGPDSLQDLYLRIKKIPVIGNVKIGYFNEPISLEHLTSNKYITFLERGLPNALAPDKNWGVMAHNHVNDRATWQVGVFKSFQSNAFSRWGSSNDGQAVAVTGRVTWLPVYENEGRRLVHLGAWGSVRWPEERIKYSARPEAHFVKSLTSTGSFAAKRLYVMGAEGAWVCGPFSAQAEYVAALTNSTYGYQDQFFHGLTVQTSYFLTGEHRPYSTKSGVFKGVKPKQNFVSGGGLGAWEVAARYSYLDLTGSQLGSGARKLQDFTAGVNWYLNPNLRISFNYIHAWLNAPNAWTEGIDMFMLRFQAAI